MNEIGVGNHAVRVPILDYELLVTRDPENMKVKLPCGVWHPLLYISINQRALFTCQHRICIVADISTVSFL